MRLFWIFTLILVVGCNRERPGAGRRCAIDPSRGGCLLGRAK